MQEARVEDLQSKVQWLVDHWPATLEDGGITFPDGDFWPMSPKKEADKPTRGENSYHGHDVLVRVRLEH